MLILVAGEELGQMPARLNEIFLGLLLGKPKGFQRGQAVGDCLHVLCQVVLHSARAGTSQACNITCAACRAASSTSTPLLARAICTGRPGPGTLEFLSRRCPCWRLI